MNLAQRLFGVSPRLLTRGRSGIGCPQMGQSFESNFPGGVVVRCDGLMQPPATNSAIRMRIDELSERVEIAQRKPLPRCLLTHFSNHVASHAQQRLHFVGNVVGDGAAPALPVLPAPRTNAADVFRSFGHVEHEQLAGCLQFFVVHDASQVISPAGAGLDVGSSFLPLADRVHVQRIAMQLLRDNDDRVAGLDADEHVGTTKHLCAARGALGASQRGSGSGGPIVVVFADVEHVDLLLKGGLGRFRNPLGHCDPSASRLVRACEQVNNYFSRPDERSVRPNKQQTTSEIINMRTYAFVGTIGLSTPLDIANRAITATDKLGGNSTSRYYLRADAKGRIYAHRITRKRTNETGLFCGYARSSDPDWLAEEIEGVADGRG